MTVREDWYVSYYQEDYAESVRGVLTAERSDAEVDFILSVTGLQTPARVADIACGEGRHCLSFARRGFSVTGVDQNEIWLERARTLVGDLPVTFVSEDMRVPVTGPFDLAVSLFHSFGFFSDGQNRDMLSRWADQLVPGGWLALDVWNVTAMLLHWTPIHEWTASDQLAVREERSFDPLSSRITIHYRYAHGDGDAHEYDASFRVYTYTELHDLLLACGLTPTHIFGSLEGQPYAVDARRLVVFARKA